MSDPREQHGPDLQDLGEARLVEMTASLTSEIVVAGASLSCAMSLLLAVLTEHLSRRVLAAAPTAVTLTTTVSDPLDRPLREALGYGRADLDRVLVFEALLDAKGDAVEHGMSEAYLGRWLARSTPMLGLAPFALDLPTRSWLVRDEDDLLPGEPHQEAARPVLRLVPRP